MTTEKDFKLQDMNKKMLV